MRERWRAITGYPGYQVSDFGRVRSLPRLGVDGRRWKGKMLKPFGKIYPAVGLSRGKAIVVHIHRLVLTAFRGPCPPGLEGCHNNGNHKDARLPNLRWDTRAANCADCTAHGTRRYLRGTLAASAKLTEKLIPGIRKQYAEGTSMRALGRKHGVSHNTISAAIRGTSWSHV